MLHFKGRLVGDCVCLYVPAHDACLGRAVQRVAGRSERKHVYQELLVLVLPVDADFYRYLGVEHNYAPVVDYHRRLELYVGILGDFPWGPQRRVGKDAKVRLGAVCGYERVGDKRASVIAPVPERGAFASKDYLVTAK